jgi:hypothetical protein
MIFTRFAGLTVHRMHTPKWAVAPASGAGAAEYGGRANRPGVAALYLALEAQTAIDEYQQVSPLLPPGTMVSYQVTADPILDFRAGYAPAHWSALWEEFFCDGRELWFNLPQLSLSSMRAANSANHPMSRRARRAPPVLRSSGGLNRWERAGPIF